MVLWKDRLQPLTLRHICVTCVTTRSQLKDTFGTSARNSNHWCRYTMRNTAGNLPPTVCFLLLLTCCLILGRRFTSGTPHLERCRRVALVSLCKRLCPCPHAKLSTAQGALSWQWAPALWYPPGCRSGCCCWNTELTSHFNQRALGAARSLRKNQLVELEPQASLEAFISPVLPELRLI